MDTTPLGFPYPECDPPEVKDLSDINQVHALAEAVNSFMQILEDRAETELLEPPTGRMIMTALTATTANEVIPAFNSATFATGGMGTVTGGLLVPTRGWYLAGTYSLVNYVGAPFEVRTQLLRNSTAVMGYGTVSQTVNSLPYQTGVFLCNAGDIIGVRIRHETAGSPSWSYQSRIWGARLVEV